jgi:hypothetical protein
MYITENDQKETFIIMHEGLILDKIINFWELWEQKHINLPDIGKSEGGQEKNPQPLMRGGGRE